MKKVIKVLICCLLTTGIARQSVAQTTIKMRTHGNVYILPCSVNGLLLDMIFDTGADDVSLSASDALYMIKNGYINESDISGKENFLTASGEMAQGAKVTIKKITFAGLELTNVEATIMPNSNAPLLLGQTAIRKLGVIQLDPENNTLTVFKGKGNYDYSKSEPAEKHYEHGNADEGGDPRAGAISFAAASKSGW